MSESPRGKIIMLDKQMASHLAEDWIDAWNRHDLGAIMSHYADNISFWSPIIITRMGIVDGHIAGKDNLQAYFSKGLERNRNLHFKLHNVFLGTNSLVIHYSRENGVEATEIVVIDELSGKVIEARAHYNPPIMPDISQSS
jgi:hypothetical protein